VSTKVQVHRNFPTRKRQPIMFLKINEIIESQLALILPKKKCDCFDWSVVSSATGGFPISWSQDDVNPETWPFSPHIIMINIIHILYVYM